MRWAVRAALGAAGLVTILGVVASVISFRQFRAGFAVRPTRVHLDASGSRKRALLSVDATIVGDEVAYHQILIDGGFCDLRGGVSGAQQLFRAHVVSFRRGNPGEAHIAVELEHGSLQQARQIMQDGPLAEFACSLAVGIDLFHTNLRVYRTYDTGNLLLKHLGEANKLTWRVRSDHQETTLPDTADQIARLNSTHWLEVAIPAIGDMWLSQMLKDVPLTVKGDIRFEDADLGAFHVDARIDSAVHQTRLPDASMVFSVPLRLNGAADIKQTAAVIAGALTHSRARQDGTSGDKYHLIPAGQKGFGRPQNSLLLRAREPSSALAVLLGTDHTVGLVQDDGNPDLYGSFKRFGSAARRLLDAHEQRRLTSQSFPKPTSRDDAHVSMNLLLQLDENTVIRADMGLLSTATALTYSAAISMYMITGRTLESKTFSTWKKSAEALTAQFQADLESSKPAGRLSLLIDHKNTWGWGQSEVEAGKPHFIKHTVGTDEIIVKATGGFDVPGMSVDAAFHMCTNQLRTVSKAPIPTDLYTYLTMADAPPWYVDATGIPSSIAALSSPAKKRRLAEVKSALWDAASEYVIRARKLRDDLTHAVQPVRNLLNNLTYQTRLKWQELEPVRKLAKQDDLTNFWRDTKNVVKSVEKEDFCIDFNTLIDLDGDGVSTFLDVGGTFSAAGISADGRLHSTKPSSGKTLYKGSLTVGESTAVPLHTLGVKGSSPEDPGQMTMDSSGSVGVDITLDETASDKVKVTGSTTSGLNCIVNEKNFSAIAAKGTDLSAINKISPECAFVNGSASCCSNGMVYGLMSELGSSSASIAVDFAKPVNWWSVPSAGSLSFEGSQPGLSLSFSSETKGSVVTGTTSVSMDGQEMMLITTTSQDNNKNSKDLSVSVAMQGSEMAKGDLSVSQETADKNGAAYTLVIMGDTANAMTGNVMVDTTSQIFGTDGISLAVNMMVSGNEMVDATHIQDRTSKYGAGGGKVTTRVSSGGQVLVVDENTLDLSQPDIMEFTFSQQQPEAVQTGRVKFWHKGDDKFSIWADVGMGQPNKLFDLVFDTIMVKPLQWQNTLSLTVSGTPMVQADTLMNKVVQGSQTTYDLACQMPGMGTFTGMIRESAGPTIDVTASFANAESQKMFEKISLFKKTVSGGTEAYSGSIQVLVPGETGMQEMLKVESLFEEDSSKLITSATVTMSGQTLASITGNMPKAGGFYVGDMSLAMGESPMKFGVNASDGYLKTTKFGNGNYGTFYTTITGSLMGMDAALDMRVETDPWQADLSGGGFGVALRPTGAQSDMIKFALDVDFPFAQASSGSGSGASGPSPTPSPPPVIVSTMAATVAVADPTTFKPTTMAEEMASDMGVATDDVKVKSIEHKVSMGYTVSGTVTRPEAQAALAEQYSVETSKVEVTIDQSNSRRLQTGTTIQATIKTADATKAKAIKTQASSGDTSALTSALEKQGVTGVTATLSSPPVATVEVELEVISRTGVAAEAPSSGAMTKAVLASGGTGATVKVTKIETLGSKQEELSRAQSGQQLTWMVLVIVIAALSAP